MTRSSIKPRLLFATQKTNEDAPEDTPEDAEEATTDVETSADAGEATDEPDIPPGRGFAVDSPMTTEATKKRSPFDTWPRTKPGRGGGRVKRSGSPLEKSRGAVVKRSRSVQPDT